MPNLFLSLFQSPLLPATQPLTYRLFPDGESYIRFETPLNNQEVIFVDSLNQPNEKIIPLIMAADAARQEGAQRIGLIAPYLAYMRQDKKFHPGEAITSKTMARLISQSFDWMITIDPHLHRYKALSDIYTIPALALSAAPILGDWIRQHVTNPLLVGPDSESAQWVSEAAQHAQAPFIILEKTRHGDHDVDITIPNFPEIDQYTPVLVDDIISTGQTMIQAAAHFSVSPYCVGVHGVFSGSAYDNMKQANFAEIITCNTIPHPTNQIDIWPLIASALAPQ